MRLQCVGAKDAVEALELGNAAVDLGGSIVSISTGGIEHAFLVWFMDAELADVLTVAKGRRE